MRKNSARFLALLFMMVILMAAAPVIPVQAASATITITTEDEEIKVGEMVTITLTIAADATIGDFEGYLKYDSNILEFTSAASCITGGAGLLKISDKGASPSVQERNYNIIFKAIDKGSCKLELDKRPVVYAYADYSEMSVTGFAKTVLVYPQPVVSDNSSLRALHVVDNLVRTAELTPAFAPEIISYYTAVPYEAERVVVSALATDDKATVQVQGSGTLALGQNELSVLVTAEDGSTSEYLIYVYRSEEPSVTDEPEPPEEQNPGASGEAQNPVAELTKGVTVGEEGTEVIMTEYHTYIICDEPGVFTVPEGYSSTVVMIDGVPVNAYRRADERFVIMTLVNENGQVQWYRYDEADQTIQKVFNSEITITQVNMENSKQVMEDIQAYEIQLVGLRVGLVFLTILSLVLVVIILWLCIKLGMRKKYE